MVHSSYWMDSMFRNYFSVDFYNLDNTVCREAMNPIIYLCIHKQLQMETKWRKQIYVVTEFNM